MHMRNGIVLARRSNLIAKVSALRAALREAIQAA